MLKECLRGYSKDQKATPTRGNPASIFESLFPGLSAPQILSPSSQIQHSSPRPHPEESFSSWSPLDRPFSFLKDASARQVFVTCKEGIIISTQKYH